MATVIGKLAVILTTKTEGVKTSIDSLTDRIKGLKSGIAGKIGDFAAPFKNFLSTAKALPASLGGAFAAIGGPAGTALAALSSFSKLTDLAAEQREVIKGLNIEAKAAGIPLSQLIVLQEAAGPAADKVSGAVAKFTKELGKAVVGNEEAQQTFRALGISWQELNAKSPQEQFKILADRLNGLKSDSERAYFATKLFGDSAGELSTLLSGGSKGIEEAERRAKNFGLVVTQSEADLVKASQAANAEFGKLGTGAGRQLAVAGAALVKPFQDLFLGLAEKIGPVFTAIKDVAVGVGNAIGGAFSFLKPVISTVGFLIGKVVDVFSFLGKVIGSVGEAIGALGDVFTNTFGKAIGLVSSVAEKIGGVVSKIGSGIVNAGKTVGGFIKNVADKTGVSKVVSKVGSALKFVGEKTGISGAISKGVGFVKGIFGGKKESAEAKAKKESETGALVATEKLTQSIKEQIFAIGKTSEELDLYKLKQQGASKAQLDSVRDLQRQLRARTIEEEVMSPLAKFEREMARLQDLRGVISDEAFNLKAGAIFESFASGIEAQRKPLPTADVFGSTAAQSAITAFLTGRQADDPQERLIRVTREAKEIQERILRNGERLVEAFEGRARARIG